MQSLAHSNSLELKLPKELQLCRNKHKRCSVGCCILWTVHEHECNLGFYNFEQIRIKARGPFVCVSGAARHIVSKVKALRAVKRAIFLIIGILMQLFIKWLYGVNVKKSGFLWKEHSMFECKQKDSNQNKIIKCFDRYYGFKHHICVNVWWVIIHIEIVLLMCFCNAKWHLCVCAQSPAAPNLFWTRPDTSEETVFYFIGPPERRKVTSRISGCVYAFLPHLHVCHLTRAVALWTLTVLSAAVPVWMYEVCEHVLMFSTGKTPASPYEYGSFGEFGACFIIYVASLCELKAISASFQLTTAARWAQRPSRTAPRLLTTTTDTWVRKFTHPARWKVFTPCQLLHVSSRYNHKL